MKDCTSLCKRWAFRVDGRLKHWLRWDTAASKRAALAIFRKDHPEYADRDVTAHAWPEGERKPRE